MPVEATSQHLRNAHELLILVPLRTGFVQTSERVTSYPSRLRSLLSLLFRPSQSSVERTLMPSASFMDKLQNVYHFHYGVVEHLQRPHLILSATFDSSWEAYFHNLVDNVGHFLDAIFCHCEGFDGRSCADGYEAFADFIREHQVQSSLFYSANPDLTVDDIRILRKGARGYSVNEPIGSAQAESMKEIPGWAARGEVLRPDGEFKRARERDLERLLLAMWDIRSLFPEVEELTKPNPLAPGEPRTAQSIFDAGAGQLYSALKAANQGANLQPNLPADVAGWVGGLEQAARPAAAPNVPTLTPERLQNIQGNILKRYDAPASNLGLMVLLQLPLQGDRATFIRELAALVTTADPHAPVQDGVRVNVAFTWGGLRRLGLRDEVLDEFPKEFREGMEARAGMLGDSGYPNHPSYWADLPLLGMRDKNGGAGPKFRLAEVDVIMVLQGHTAPALNDHVWSDAHPFHQVLADRLATFSISPLVLRVEALRLGKDHFGLFDPAVGESQPEPLVGMGDLPAPRVPPPGRYDNTIALGELLLGYPDKRGQIARCSDPQANPSSAELFRDGSFLVVRKLKQDCKAFDEYLRSQALAGLSEGHARERLVGRDGEGRTLVASPVEPDPGNDFDYSSDSGGTKCPFSAHVRKTNPRTESTPRIMRRSFPYGPDLDRNVPGSSEQERGLMFMAYNASIAQQYEVIQRWIGGGNSTGTLSSRTDLLGGGQPSLVAGSPGQKPFIELCWGMYLFVPSLHALEFLAKQSSPQLAESPQEGRAREGEAISNKLLAISNVDVARAAWKRLIEEDAYAEDAEALWEYVREHKEPLLTPYGVLIADLDTAQEILRDSGEKYSVRTYWERLREVIGEHYLALDRAHPASDASSASGLDVAFGKRIDEGPSYDELAQEPNCVMREHFTMEGAYQIAHDAAAEYLAHEPTFDVRELAKFVVATISHAWFDLPEDPSQLLSETRKLLQHYVTISRNCFFPWPEAWENAEIAKAKDGLEKASKKVTTLKSKMAMELLGRYRGEADVRLAMTGALVGFVPASLGHIAGTVVRGFEEGELLALARNVAQKPLAQVSEVLLGPVLKSITDHPVPTILYRVALEGSRFEPGTIVVLGLQAISREARRRGLAKPERWLFGGEPRVVAGGASHGCPGRDPSIGILLGVLTAVARYAPLERVSALRFACSVP